MKNTGNKQNAVFEIGLIYLYTFAAELLLSSVLFAFHLMIQGWWLIVSFFLGSLSAYIISGRKHSSDFIKALSAALITAVLLTLIANLVADQSYDGNAYHKLAVGLLKNGWNPVYEDPAVLESELNISGLSRYNLWITSYCKFPWIFAASVYSLTGKLEYGKVYTLIGMLMLFCLSEPVFRKKFTRNQSILLALAISVNPVAAAQCDTFYVDGFLQIIFFVLALSLLWFDINPDQEDDHLILSVIWSAMLICSAVKFTGLLYGGIFCFGNYLIYVYLHRQKNSGQLNHRLFWSYVLLAVLCVFLAGLPTYVVNLIRHGNPVYPLLGGEVDIMTPLSPFSSGNRAEHLFLSIFSQVDHFSSKSGQMVQLKVPFTFHYDEIRFLKYSDVKLSGFGPFFSGALLLSAGISALSMKACRKTSLGTAAMANMALCLLLTFAIEESWWARYAPYLYLLVFLGLILGLSQKRAFKVAADAGLAAMLLSSIAFGAYLPRQAQFTHSIKNEIAAIRDSGKRIILDDTGASPASVCFDLMDYGVPFSLSDDPDLPYIQEENFEIGYVIEENQ